MKKYAVFIEVNHSTSVTVLAKNKTEAEIQALETLQDELVDVTSLDTDIEVTEIKK